MKTKRIILTAAVVLAASFGLAGCSDASLPVSSVGSHEEQGKAMEKNQKRLQSNYKIPQLEQSLEIENNHRRLEFLNKSDAIGYVYLMSHGKVVTFYTIRGKVSSLNSYSTAMEQIVDSDGDLCSGPNGYCSAGSGYMVQAPDIDGSYGKNVEGIYFFTTENAYVEWAGEYMYSSEPLKITTPLELVREVK